MAVFKILNSRKISLHRIELINQSLHTIAMILSATGTMLSVFFSSQFDDGLWLYFLLGWAVLIIAMLIYVVFETKLLSQIGQLKLTKSGLYKSIHEKDSFYPYNDILFIKIEPHLRSFFFPSNIEKCKTFYVTIITEDKVERFIVSSQSYDKPEVSLTETIKRIEEIQKKSLTQHSFIISFGQQL